jgi:hypothetical protein
MKTFIEWLELKEAGFFSNLFGGRSQGIQGVQQPQGAQSEEEKKKDIKNRAYDDAMELLVPGYKLASGQNQPPTAQPSSSRPQQQNKPSKVRDFPKSGGATLLDQLHDLVGDKIPSLKSVIDNKESKDSDQIQRLGDVFRKLSYAKTGYGAKEALGMSGSDIEKAYEIVDKILKQDYGLETYPAEDVVMPYEKSNWDWKEYAALDEYVSPEGRWESNPRPGVVISKGFRKGSKIFLKAFVSLEMFK